MCHSSVVPAPLIDTWAASASATQLQDREQPETERAGGKGLRLHVSLEQQKQQQQEQRRAHFKPSATRMPKHEADSISQNMSTELMLSYAATSRSLAASRQVCAVLCVAFANASSSSSLCASPLHLRRTALLSTSRVPKQTLPLKPACVTEENGTQVRLNFPARCRCTPANQADRLWGAADERRRQRRPSRSIRRRARAPSRSTFHCSLSMFAV
jgi:hypothetical protein